MKKNERGEKMKYRPEKLRPLMILDYLVRETDEEHPSSVRKINDYLQAFGMAASPETVRNDLLSLRETGCDVVCLRSSRNLYYLRTLPFSLQRKNSPDGAD